MADSMKNFIERRLKENIPLTEIKKDLKEKGYEINEINKAVREAIAGVNKKLPPVTIVQIGVLVVGVAIAIGVGVYFTGYKASQESSTAVKSVSELCQTYPAVSREIGCEDAANLISDTYNGKITDIILTDGEKLDLDPSFHDKSFWKMGLTLSEPIEFLDSTITGNIEVIVDNNTGRVQLYQFTSV